MTIKKYVGVFDATLLYHEMAIYFGLPKLVPTLKQRAAIAYLIDKECFVEYHESVNSWYKPVQYQMQFYDFNVARHLFHECFDYFLFGSRGFDNIYLQFSGNNVFVSNFDYDLKRLNKR